MSNRSLAAARSRRTPQEVVSESSMKKNQQIPQQKRPNTAPSNAPSSGASQNKMSIGDAIGLITIRLSKLESHMLKEQTEPNLNVTASGGVTDVDTVLRSLVSRVTGLEKSSESVEQTLGDLNEAVKELEENPQIQIQEAVSNKPDPLLLERIEKAEREISDLKLLVIKLQTMLIETTLSVKTQQPVLSSYQSSLPLTPSPSPSPPYQPEESTTGSMILEI
jgi:hypothetical protein